MRLIDADMAREDMMFKMCGTGYQYNAMSVIDRQPTTDAEPVVHGQWDEERFAFCNVCSNCGLVIDRTSIKMHSGKFNYCPNCGAKMDEKGV